MKMHIINPPPGPGLERLQALMHSGALPDLCIFNGPWIAGGAVRRIASGKDIIEADIDLFFPSMEEWTAASEVISKRATHVYSTTLANTYKVPLGDNVLLVQAIKRKMYMNAGQVFADFDFSVCQFATDGKHVVYADTALEDLKNNQLRRPLKGRVTSKGLVKRFLKYTKYGFRPTKATVLSALRQAQKYRWDPTSKGLSVISMADDFYDTDVEIDQHKWVEL